MKMWSVYMPQKLRHRVSNTTHFLKQPEFRYFPLIARKVQIKIVSKITSAKYFPVPVDSTPDLSHVNQLSIIVWSVQNDVPVLFLMFLQIGSHKAEDLSNVTLIYLDNVGINFQNCHGQSYDIASNMEVNIQECKQGWNKWIHWQYLSHVQCIHSTWLVQVQLGTA